MRTYEGLFVLPAEASAETRKEQFKALDDLIAKFQGKVLRKEEHGVKQLGYEINKSRRGFVLVVDYQLPTQEATAFTKALELSDVILKYMVSNKEKIKENPPRPKPKAAVGQSSERAAKATSA